MLEQSASTLTTRVSRTPLNKALQLTCHSVFQSKSGSLQIEGLLAQEHVVDGAAEQTPSRFEG